MQLKSNLKLASWSLVLVCVWLSQVANAVVEPISPDAPETIVITHGGMLELKPAQTQYLLESKAVTAAELFSPAAAADWQSVVRKTINIGKQRTPVWFRFKVRSDLDVEARRLLELRWTHIRKVDFYQRRGNGQILHSEAGLEEAGFEHYGDSASYLFQLPLQPGEESDLLIRVVSLYNINLPLFVWEQNRFPVQHANQLTWYYIAFGVLFAMMLYNTSLYVFTRDQIYFYYSLYALSIVVYELAISGIGNRYLWGGFEWMRFNAFPQSINLSFLCSGLFVRSFLNLKSHRGWLLWLNNISNVYWALNTLLVLVGIYWLYPLAEPMIGFTCFAGLATGIYLWIKGSISARYFTIAWGALILFTLATMLMMEGWLPRNFSTENGQIVGFIMELLLLSFALAERINREREQRELAQQHALSLQLEITEEREDRMRAQQSLLELQQQTNLELEARVAQRTDELEQALSQLEQANRDLATLSVTDPLTSLSNRRYFDEGLERELQRVQRSGKPLALVLLDIDHFKRINDTYGHLVGDECLQQVANTLRQQVGRSTDLIARFGGEEFVVILVDTCEEDAFRVAESIREAVRQQNCIHLGRRIAMSVSLGVAGVSGKQAVTPNQLLAAADEALYKAKNKGRNCSVLAQLMAS